ncbi:hypothetical protein Tco_0919610 [Tanacetum coccineum]
MTSQLHDCFITSQLHDFFTSSRLLHNFTTSQLHNFTTSSQPQDFFITLWLHFTTLLISQLSNTTCKHFFFGVALGWHLEEIHATWAHLEKKRTRLRLYTKSFEETVHTGRRDSVAITKRRHQDFHSDGVIDLAMASEQNINQFRNGFTLPPNEIDMDDLEPDEELVDTPLVSPFLDSDDDSDDGEVLNELEEYGNAGQLCRQRAINSFDGDDLAF